MASRIVYKSVIFSRQTFRGLPHTRFCHHQKTEPPPNFLYTYIRKVIDNPLPIGAGALVVGLLQLKRIRKREERLNNEESIEGTPAEEWKVDCYKALPLRHVSRLWGFINEIYLPEWMRVKVLTAYANTFGCNLHEAECEDLTSYNNLGEFFRRRLKSTARPVQHEHCLVSPSDSKVLHFGEVNHESGDIEQVKGVNYSLKYFLGSGTPHPVVEGSSITPRPGNRLYQCVLYLAPGDYHGFHSPAQWTVTMRRHFPGELLSVNPRVARLVPRLFELNERVVYIGEWEHGFFSLAAVGATNVGSVHVPFDPSLQTNQRRMEKNTFHQEIFKEVKFEKGDFFGEFRLGSTLVLVFEAPEGTKFGFKHEETVKVGQGIVHLPVQEDTKEDTGVKVLNETPVEQVPKHSLCDH